MSALGRHCPTYIAKLAQIPLLAVPTRQDHEKVLQNCIS
jgi:hypothetical protein